MICIRQLKEKLTKHIVEHPIDFGTSEAETVLDFLYGAYCKSHENDPPETKNLCIEHERRGFTEGIRWGMQIAAETGEGD